MGVARWIPPIVLAVLCVDPPSTTQAREAAPTLASLEGGYIRSNGFVSSRLEFKPGGRFSFDWRADDGGRIHKEGTVTLADGLLRLHPLQIEFNLAVTFQDHPKLRPIRWGDRIYLVEDERARDFCDAINLGTEPRADPIGPVFFARYKTSAKPDANTERELETVAGQPAIPTGWKALLIGTPLKGRVIEVLPETQARVDLGSKDGFRVGMKLCILGDNRDGKRHFAIAHVIAVDVNQSDVELDVRRLPRGELKKGLEVLSRIPDEFAPNRLLFTD